MKRAALLAAGFAYMVLLIEAIRAAVAWWRGDLAQPGWSDMALIALLPALVWIWWRHISPFGRDCPRCLVAPAERQGATDAARGDSGQSSSGR